MMLAWRKVPVMLVERHAGTSIQPKAFGVGPRAVELMRPVPGLERTLSEIWAGIGDTMRIAIATDLSDPNPQMIISDEKEAFAFLADATPAAQVGAPQAEVERVLRAKAEELGADLRFSTELISLEQDGDGVTAVIRAGGEDTLVQADYVVAADGFRSPLRQALGIPVEGKGELGEICSIMFDADLSGLVREREVTLWYLQNDAFTGVIVTGTGVGSHVLGVNYSPTAGQNEDDFTPERCAELVRLAVGVPDLDVRVLDKTSFAMAHILAERYREGRVFLAGDAAHTMPPTGGQGGSTALQDGCDLAWRLWLVVTGQAGPDFLDTYDAERRPIGVLTADAQLANLGQRMPPSVRIGYPEPLEDPLRAMLGCRYHSTAIIDESGDDGSLLEDSAVPSGPPGQPSPARAARPGGAADLRHRPVRLGVRPAGRSAVVGGGGPSGGGAAGRTASDGRARRRVGGRRGALAGALRRRRGRRRAGPPRRLHRLALPRTGRRPGGHSGDGVAADPQPLTPAILAG